MPDKHVLSPDVMTKTVRPGPPGLAAVTPTGYEVGLGPKNASVLLLPVTG